jgi:uncharacterized membrane protein
VLVLSSLCLSVAVVLVERCLPVLPVGAVELVAFCIVSNTWRLALTPLLLVLAVLPPPVKVTMERTLLSLDLPLSVVAVVLRSP